ncbi:MAG: hypothetical protein QXO85_06385 [Sulfolobales archaeon]
MGHAATVISEGIRKWAKGDVRRVYYPFLAIYVAFAIYVFGAYIATGTTPLIILLLSANIANFGGFFAWYLLWDIERKLPKELRLRWYYWPFLGRWLFIGFHALLYLAFQPSTSQRLPSSPAPPAGVCLQLSPAGSPRLPSAKQSA